jgi:sugar transferase (PEP-CTERM/EpsH1 system associated)
MLKTKYNILHVTFSLGMGGLENLVLELLTRLDKDRFTPALCTLQSAGKLQEVFEKRGIPVHVLEKREGLDVSLPFRLARLIREKNIDIVHSHNYAPWLYAGGAAKVLNDRPLVHTEHSRVPGTQHSALWGERLVSRVTDLTVADCAYVHEFLLTTVEVRAHKSRVIYNGIDTDKYHSSVDVASKREELSLTPDVPVAGIVARLVPVKHHVALLEAFKIVVRALPTAQLLIVGDGELRGELEEYVKELGIVPNVRFLGTRFDIPELLRIMDVVTLTSLSEGFSLALLEAMAAEAPVVASDVGGNSEIVVNGKTGFIVPVRDPVKLADALLMLLKDRALARRMGGAGYRRVMEQFDLSKMASEYENVYTKLGEGRNKRI